MLISQSFTQTREEDTVKSTTRSSHILFNDLGNNTDILNNILAVQFPFLDSFQQGFGACFESETGITITCNLILLGKFRFGLDERVTSSADCVDKCLRVGSFRKSVTGTRWGGVELYCASTYEEDRPLWLLVQQPRRPWHRAVQALWQSSTSIQETMRMRQEVIESLWRSMARRFH